MTIFPWEGNPANVAARRGVIRRGQGWKLFFAWAVVPPLLLCIAELGLRRAGFGHSAQLFVAQEIGGKTFYQANHFFYDQFFV